MPRVTSARMCRGACRDAPRRENVAVGRGGLADARRLLLLSLSLNWCCYLNASDLLPEI
jgi:hypothetical protein